MSVGHLKPDGSYQSRITTYGQRKYDDTIYLLSHYCLLEFWLLPAVVLLKQDKTSLPVALTCNRIANVRYAFSSWLM